MSSADFRQIAVKGRGNRPERLFRAAIASFCALTRPSRLEISQLEELTLPLFDSQPRDARRFAAAALSEIAQTPNALTRRLLQEPVDIAAPLLVRSETLSDADLIMLIAEHGLPFARAIARRDDLHPAIAGLIRMLELQQPLTDEQMAQLQAGPAVDQSATTPMEANDMPHEIVEPAAALDPITQDAPATRPIDAAERMRERLRGFMAPRVALGEGPSQVSGRTRTFARLKLTALSGNKAFFHTALADALDIDFSLACSIAAGGGYTSLIAGLKALHLTSEQAFMITAAVFPTFFSHAESVRLFSDRYDLMHSEAAMDMVRGWRAESAARSFLRTRPALADNSDKKPSNVRLLRAS